MGRSEAQSVFNPSENPPTAERTRCEQVGKKTLSCQNLLKKLKRNLWFLQLFYFHRVSLVFLFVSCRKLFISYHVIAPARLGTTRARARRRSKYKLFDASKILILF